MPGQSRRVGPRPLLGRNHQTRPRPFNPQRCWSKGHRWRKKRHRCRSEGHRRHFQGQRCPKKGHACRSKRRRCRFERRRCTKKGHACRSERQRCPEKGHAWRKKRHRWPSKCRRRLFGRAMVAKKTASLPVKGATPALRGAATHQNGAKVRVRGATRRPGGWRRGCQMSCVTGGRLEAAQAYRVAVSAANPTIRAAPTPHRSGRRPPAFSSGAVWSPGLG